MSAAALHPSMIERCQRAVRHPARAITAPEPDRIDFIDESLRLAQFAQSAATHSGVVAPFPGPATATPSHPTSIQAVAGPSFPNRSNR